MTGLRRIFRKNEHERQLDTELRFHFDSLVAENLRAGMSEAEARRKARLEFGGLDQVKEECRDSWGMRWLEDIYRDMRFAVRSLCRCPAFTITSLVTLALGIGANVAVFSVVSAALLRPLNAPDPDRVITFLSTNKQGSGPGASEIKFNLWREQTRVLQDVSGYTTSWFNLTGVDRPQRVDAAHVTADYFRLFGLPLSYGRAFTVEEETPNSRNVAILSHTLWKRVFAGDPRMVGRVISLSGFSYEVVGIIAENAKPEAVTPPDIWVPFPIDPASDNQLHYFQATGRLKPGITLGMANAHLELTTLEFRRRYPTALSTNRGDVFSVQPLRDVQVKDVRTAFFVLSGAVAFVLLIACANVANLLLVRAGVRRRELAIRMAVGAARQRIVRQLLTECALLALVAAALGLYLGIIGIHAILAVNTANLPRLGLHGSNVTLDWRVLTFTGCVTVVSALLFGLIPALQTSRTGIHTSLKESNDRAGLGISGHRTRSLLAISQVSLALVLLIGASLLIRTLMSVRSTNPGFDAHGVVATLVTLDPKFTGASSVDRINQDILRRLHALPGVEQAAFTGLLPLEGNFNSLPVTIVDKSNRGAPDGNSRWMTVSPGYFNVLKIPPVRGRLFTDNDRRDAPRVAIINQAMARQLWPGGDPLKDQLIIGKGLGQDFGETTRRIVGIVGDVHEDALNQNPLPAVFTPFEQRGSMRLSNASPVWRMWTIVRTRANSGSFNSAIESELRQATGGLPVAPVHSMESVVMKSTARQSFDMLLMTVFGCAALLLAAVGIYGLMSFTVQSRTQEMGIRIALGSSSAAVRNRAIVQGMRLSLIGIAAGILAALGLTRLLMGFLYGVQPQDPITFVTVPIFLAAVALLACYIPARRATRINPSEALRWE